MIARTQYGIREAKSGELDKEFKDDDTIVCPGFTRSDLPNRKIEHLSFLEQVNCFEAQYRLWIFEFAEILVKGENDYASVHIKADKANEINEQSLDKVTVNSGFAVLAVLNPYFDLIGKLCGDFPNYPYKANNSSHNNLRSSLALFERILSFLQKYRSPDRRIPPEDFIKEGIKLVFPELKKINSSLQGEVVNILYKRIRNSVAHVGLTDKQVILSLDYDFAVTYGKHNNQTVVVINTHRWYDCLDSHFEDYVNKLKMKIHQSRK